MNGGPAQQFTQEAIAEFQVLTNGYKAEFGQASGAVVNVITKSGGNAYQASARCSSGTMRWIRRIRWTRREQMRCRSAATPTAPRAAVRSSGQGLFLRLGGHTSEDRQLDFKYPDTGSAVVNQLLRDQEAPFDVPTRTSETRAFIKFDQQVGQHQLTQQVNYTDSELRASCRCRRQRACPRREMTPTPAGCCWRSATRRCWGMRANPMS